ncbi:hypothetical protein [Pelagibius sp. Alg239-R121]|uniref:hypothetical protein n=1 Tax=Pelagibius sp. Alg239-R121 TaxID=2993448 RepID=UPI0024A72330|nr:hypothetical protein [Pelagibius sp. Alg239-R121]
MAWNLPDNYDPPALENLKRHFATMQLGVNSTALRMYQIVVKGKVPIYADDFDEVHVVTTREEEGITSSQARTAFSRSWVPSEHVAAMTDIAMRDGQSYYAD